MLSGYVTYFESDSPIARLDARVKLIVVFCIIILVFFWNNPIYLGLLVIGIILIAVLSGIPLKYLLRLLSFMITFAVILILMHGFANRWYGETPLIGPLIGDKLTMYQEGTLYGVGIAFRVLSLMLVIPLVMSTTDMNKLVLGLIDFKVPYKITFVFTMAMRFAPMIVEEINAIRDAQALRGLDPKKMNIIKRLKVNLSKVVPLLLGAMNKSTQLEIALQAKAFSGSNDRTYLHSIRMTTFDWVVGISTVVLTIAALIARFAWGFGSFPFVQLYAR